MKVVRPYWHQNYLRSESLRSGSLPARPEKVSNVSVGSVVSVVSVAAACEIEEKLAPLHTDWFLDLMEPALVAKEKAFVVDHKQTGSLADKAA